ncbi:M50 family metallopeptidase [Flavobacterium sp. AS60]|uniref:M50 family metallopeptidase n=1 Tax=Flavobacterium anseongense TaxID=2910677 RepID=UPI001F180801|nr:M50 family metallopeptidase [Flavobacterium sp. AS60]MCF6128056.1 M50 family metallopeptidase [Flavobacterium sp. AS60]
MESKKSQFIKAIRTIAVIVIFGGIGFFAAKMGIAASSGMSKLSILTLALLFIPIFFIVIAIHEAGHAIAGVWMNFDFKTFIVGPFMWQKEQSKWHFNWNKNVNTAGGLVICMPTGTENLAKRFSVYAAGGPIASLVLTLVAYGSYSLLLSSATVVEILRNTLYIMSVLSLIIFITTAFPMRANGFSSDGARVLRLLKGGDTSRFELLILKLITGASAGIRPKEIDINELNEASTLAQKLNAPFGVYLHSFFHQAEFDKGNIEKAEEHLLDYVKEVESIPKGIRNIVWLDAAFFYAFAKKDLEKAENYWNKFEPAALIPKAQILATEAAIDILKNENKTAQSKIEAAENEIANMLDNGLGIALREKLSQMKTS